MMTSHIFFLLLMAAVVFEGVRGQAQVYSQVGGTANVVIQLPDQNTRVISPSGQTMIEVGFFGPPTVSPQYQNRVSVTNYSGGFGTPSISLTFTGVQLTDAGQFQCTSTFGGNTQCGPTLVVLGAPSLPTFNVVPDPVIVGNDVEMTCTATSTSRPPSPQLVLVYVLKQNGNVITQPRTSSFIIKGVSTANKDDIFQCAAYELNTVTNELTGLVSADSDPYTLDPNFAPTDIKADPPTTSYTLNRDTPIADIRCDASCNPPCDFGWYTTPDDQIVAQGRVLSLGTVTSEEAATYVCKANNALGEKLLPIKIDVEESLGDISFDPPEETYTVLEGTNVPGILCNADCVPVCKLDWLRDGRFLYESEGIAFGQVSRDDSDTYTCRATNDKGSKEKNLVLDVQYAPDSPVLSPAALSYELEENAAVIPEIACRVDCNPDCKHEWFKDGGGNPVSQGGLSLGTATRQDTGIYQCRASNLFGSVTSEEVKIQIFYRPENVTFDPPNPTYDVQEGGTLEPITCQAQCNPTCSFQWYKDNDFSTPVSSSDVLDLSTADLEDSGQWTCVAKNSYGELQRQISVAVSFGPKVITLTPSRDTYDVEANVGVVPDVLCSAPCNPKCSVQWFKNSVPVPSTQPSAILSLGTASSNDEGVYTCRVSNRLGTLTKDVDVQVSFGPSSSIVLNPNRSVYDVNLGSSLKVTCSASCDPACSFRWVKDGGVEYSATGDLNLEQVGEKDEGIYECVADNKVGNPASRKITVNVQAGPSKVTITPPGPLSLIEGTDFLVTCTASCTPTCDVAWTRDSRPVSSVGGVLSLNGVKREMGGAYVCTASNAIGSQTGTIQIGVSHGPGNSVKLDPSKDPFQVEEGQDFEISCDADCNPPCNYTWARGRDFIGEGSTFKLTSVDRTQAGIITCLADNEVQTPKFESTNFEVMYGPGLEPNIFPGEATASVDRGDNFQARCDADCYPDCQIQWYLDGKKLQTTNGILTITSATMTDEGDYTCKADNKVGQASRNLRLQVEAGPGTSVRFDPPGSSQSAKDGSTKIVTCMADCSPPCTFHWKLGSTNISNTAVLNLDPVKRQDGGVYTCVASNSQDSLSSMQLDLNVLYGPEGTTRLIPASIASLDVGDSLNLFCVSECSPPCTYTWYLGQRAVPSKDGELKVESVSLADGGTYSCQADNGVDGKETVNIDVNIQSGPAGSITFNPPNDTMTLTQGTSLQVTCQADCTPTCSYTWSKGSRSIPSPSDGVLVIPVVTREDVGDYTCVASNGEGDQASRVLVVDVLYGPGTSMELLPPGKVQTLNEGASFQVSCRGDCNPACNYTWYFVNTPVASTGGVLSLLSLSKGEEGSYKCVASNGVGLSSEMEVFVQVQTGPGNSVRIEPPVSVYQIHEGKELSLTCSAVCSPACTYTWFFGADRFKAVDGVFRQPMATRDLSGSYVCYASNDVGVQGSRQIQVDVLYGPSNNVMLDPKENQQIEIGDILTLRCSATCNPDCTYNWFKGSKKLSSTGGRLTIGPATEDTSGDYYCRAANEVEGMDSESVSVEVLKGPGDTMTFTPDVTSLDLTESRGSTTVTCSADCIPPCTYEWKRGFDDVGDQAVNGSLTISDVTREDPTLYICYASNGVGTVASKNLQVNVQYGPADSVSIFPPMTTVEPVGGVVSLSCKATCNPDCNVQWMKGEKQLPSILGILTLTNVQASDAGDYTCVASNSIGTEMAVTRMDIVSNTGSTVEFQPPDVSPMLQEGARLSVRCSVDCIPDCDIGWTKEGMVVGVGDRLEIETVDRSDKGIYSCKADNSFGTMLSRLLSLDVTYGPVIAPSLVPPMSTQELQVGQPLISRCETECNPDCRLDWLKDGQLLDQVKNGYLLIPTVTPADAGSYTCIADNGIGQPTFTYLNVSVSFGPVDGEVNFDPPNRNRYVLDGDMFVVKCQADCMPACSFSWYIGNRKYEAEDGVLSLDPVARGDAGTYTCLASNGVGKTQTKDLDLFVEYKPSKPTLDPANTQYTPIKGQSLSPVTCMADCNPGCDFQWVKDGLILSNRKVLELRQIMTDDAGTYTCVVTNVHGRMETSMDIVVNYAPTILAFTVSNRRYIANIKENNPVDLFCKVDAMPLARIGFFNGSRLLYSEDNTDQLSFGWPKSNCYDTGNYTCVADNGVGDTQEMTMQLEILCAPRVDPRMPKKPLVTGMIGGTATITVPIIANPPASFLWYKKKGSGVREVIDVSGTPDTRGRGESEMFFYVNESSSTLVIKNVQEEDFGQYVVSMVNEEGSSTITFDLVDETKVREASTADVDATPVLLGVGIGLGFLVGAGITVIIVSTRCRPKHGHKDTSIEDWKSDTTYDTLYLRDALWAQRHMKLGANDTYRSASIPYTGVDLRQPDDTTVRYDAVNAMKPNEIISSAL